MPINEADLREEIRRKLLAEFGSLEDGIEHNISRALNRLMAAGMVRQLADGRYVLTDSERERQGLPPPPAGK